MIETFVVEIANMMKGYGIVGHWEPMNNGGTRELHLE